MPSRRCSGKSCPFLSAATMWVLLWPGLCRSMVSSAQVLPSSHFGNQRFQCFSGKIGNVWKVWKPNGPRHHMASSLLPSIPKENGTRVSTWQQKSQRALRVCAQVQGRWQKKVQIGQIWCITQHSATVLICTHLRSLWNIHIIYRTCFKNSKLCPAKCCTKKGWRNQPARLPKIASGFAEHLAFCPSPTCHVAW